jgi:succinoglycan biosynthesis protein ExoM
MASTGTPDSKAAPSVRQPVDVCICSYHRPEIRDTLASVAQQTVRSDISIRVIVADNTPLGEQRETVQAAARELGLDISYVHAPANNISIARNACLAHANSEWIAFLDDDEFASAGWLAALLREADLGGWDAVLGPVIARYEEATPSWLVEGGFHSTKPVWVEGRIATAYTGNVLFRRSIASKMEVLFREDFGTTGGEDSDFFYRFCDAGGRIGFAPDAVVFERVPAARASLKWLLRRNFRAGQSHAERLWEHKSVVPELFLAGAKVAYCVAGATAWATSTLRRNRYLTRAALHCGVFTRLSGLQPR